MYENTSLGGTLDQEICWKPTTHVPAKVAERVGELGRIRELLNENSFQGLYYTLVFPYLNYWTDIWAKKHLTYNHYADFKKSYKDNKQRRLSEHTNKLFGMFWYIFKIRDPKARSNFLILQHQ